jgi:hypothetical protein
MEMLRMILYILTRFILFFLVSLPSLIYGIFPWFLIPLGWLIRLFIGRPILSYKAGVIALKLSTIILLVVVPTILYLYLWEPLGWIFFSWMALYLVIRIYSGVHEKERVVIEAWKHLDALERKYERTYTKYNLIITLVTIILNVASLIGGYYLGGEKGLWTGVVISAVIWCLSPFARETIIDKSSGGG